MIEMQQNGMKPTPPPPPYNSSKNDTLGATVKAAEQKLAGQREIIKKPLSERVQDISRADLDAIVYDIGKFKDISKHAFDVWDMLNRNASHKEVIDMLASRGIPISKDTVRRFKEEIVEKYGRLAGIASDDMVDHLEMRVKMALEGRIETLEGLEAIKNFSMMVLMDSDKIFREATKRQKSTLRGISGRDKTIEDDKDMAVKRAKEVVPMFINAASNVEKYRRNDDLEYMEVGKEMSEEDRNKVLGELNDVLNAVRGGTENVGT